MKLFLASTAKHPESLQKLTAFVGGFEDKRLVYIPTAANGESFGSWKNGESLKRAQALGAASFEIVELEDCDKSDILSTLESADILWMAGGMSGYLLSWIRRVELDRALPELLSSGMIYVGSSAGSMICAPTQYSAEWFLDGPEPGAGLVPGLGLIDFEIYPHFVEKRLPEIEKHWREGEQPSKQQTNELYLLKDGEALTVVDGVVTVLGKKRILKR